MEPSSASPNPDQSSSHVPYEGVLSEIVKKLKSEPFLFVIAIAVILIGLAVFAADTNDLRFLTLALVITFLAFTVIIGYFLREIRGVFVAQGKQIEAMQVALTGLLSSYEHEYLRRLAEGRPIRSQVGDEEYHYEDGGKYHYSSDLYNRLVRLANLGYICPTEKNGVRRVARMTCPPEPSPPGL